MPVGRPIYGQRSSDGLDWMFRTWMFWPGFFSRVGRFGQISFLIGDL